MENSVMKENIHLMSIVGYFSSTLCGAIMGLLFLGKWDFRIWYRPWLHGLVQLL